MVCKICYRITHGYLKCLLSKTECLIFPAIAFSSVITNSMKHNILNSLTQAKKKKEEELGLVFISLFSLSAFNFSTSHTNYISKIYFTSIHFFTSSHLHKKVKALVAQSCPTLSSPMDWSPQGKNTGMGIHSLLQRMFQTQGSKVGCLHCRKILYCLSHQKSPLHLEIIIFTVLL